MGLFRKHRLAMLDKKIMGALKSSRWYRQNQGRDKMSMSLRDFDRSEEVVQLIVRFAEVVWNEKGYRALLEPAGLGEADVVDFFLLMTIATMPDPVFKSGPSNMSATLVGSAMYQEEEKQLKTCLAMLGQCDNQQEQEQFGHRYASDVMSFALDLTFAHDSAWGQVKLSQTLPGAVRTPTN